MKNEVAKKNAPKTVGVYQNDKRCWITDGQLAFLRFVLETEVGASSPVDLIDKIRDEQVIGQTKGDKP